MTDGSTALADLLALQQVDTATDQVRHQRANLPERSALAAATSRRASVRDALADIASRRRALADRQAGMERLLRDLDARAADLAAKLPRTMVVREAEALMAEQRTVAQRRSDVEDDELALLEEDEVLDAEESQRTVELDETEARVAEASDSLAAAEAILDGHLDELVKQRADAAATIPPDLLARYDALRDRLGGVAVAEIRDGRCTGCHLMLASAAIERARSAPPDAVVECEECGRLLVR